MKWFLTSTAAVMLAILGKYLVCHNWAIQDHFLGGYLTGCIVNFYINKAKKI
jgi:hypothetical protein